MSWLITRFNCLKINILIKTKILYMWKKNLCNNQFQKFQIKGSPCNNIQVLQSDTNIKELLSSWFLEKKMHFLIKYNLTISIHIPFTGKGPSWSWSYGSWIYSYLCNQWLSPLTLWVWTPFTTRWISLQNRSSWSQTKLQVNYTKTSLKCYQ